MSYCCLFLIFCIELDLCCFYHLSLYNLFLACFIVLNSKAFLKKYKQQSMSLQNFFASSYEFISLWTR